ncbi:unnamed protein product [Clonostachys rhizophaga]|uniref:Uncharacterized protein n=1 Tax=Clonostachys rhizophaga TaxID=160324 RepID=A0A9N9VCT5_9HYPO|nr:unnamed protein product [Clonostachys rhizophaga]
MADRGGFTMSGNKNTSGTQAGRVGDGSNVGYGYDQQTATPSSGGKGNNNTPFDMSDNENKDGTQVGEAGHGSNVGFRKSVNHL